MSRIGKQPIHIPEKTDVSVGSGAVVVKGPHGELSRSFPREVSIEVKDGAVLVTPTKRTQMARALWGTWASHVRNMINGVNKKYERKLRIEGVGYRAEVQPARPGDPGHSGGGNKLIMQLGFSHPVAIHIPDGLDVSVEKEVVTISGIDKERVGHFTSTIRAHKKPEPYKGKGIRYEEEVVRRKQGKKAAGAGDA